ncbi:MAG: response regulator [Marinifilaceae bacterium]
MVEIITVILLSLCLILLTWLVINRNKELVHLRHLVDDRYEITNVITSTLNCGVVLLDEEMVVKKRNDAYVLSDIFLNTTDAFIEGVSCMHTLQHISKLGNLVERVLKMQERETLVAEIGNGKTVEVEAVPVYLHLKTYGALLLKIVDITTEQELSSELREAQQKMHLTDYLYSQVLENIPGIIAIKSVTDNYRYVKVSDAFCQFLNMKEGSIIGKNDFELYPDEFAQKYRQYDVDAVKNKGHEVYETTFENCEELCWRITRTPFETIDGEKLLVTVAVNMTDVHKATEELKKAKCKAEEADRLKSKFLANMSHEIRTPLNAIVGFSEMLQYATDEEEKEEYVKLINLNNEILLRLIDDILNLSRLESGVVTFQRELFDIVDVIKNVHINFLKCMDNPDVELRLNISFRHCMVYLDKSRLNQIMTNFLTNANKFTKKGFIEIGCKEENGGIYVYVKDTGVGIPQTKQGLIFKSFEKLDEFAQGTGLGLSICKAIADSSGCKIGVKSEEGVGSTFWILLKPSIKKVEYGEQFKASSEDVMMPLGDGYSQLQNKGRNILVVEDCDSNYRLMQVLLKKYTMERAKNGEEAVTMAKNNDYSLILMDMKLPVMDGIQATKHIRCFNKHVPIIAVTGNAYESDKLVASEAGCTHFVSKPIRKEMFTKMIEEMFN